MADNLDYFRESTYPMMTTSTIDDENPMMKVILLSNNWTNSIVDETSCQSFNSGKKIRIQSTHRLVIVSVWYRIFFVSIVSV